MFVKDAFWIWNLVIFIELCVRFYRRLLMRIRMLTGLPIQVRDTALGLKDSVARGHINNTFQVKMAEEEVGFNSSKVIRV